MFTAERRLQRNGVYRARNDVYSATAFTAERRLPRNDVFAAAVAVAAAAVSAADAAAAASALAQPLTLASYPCIHKVSNVFVVVCAVAALL